MAPRSLVEMCTRVAVANVNLITGFGNMPPNDTMREILRAVKTAHQLHLLELGSEDIYDETEPHWQRIIRKDFPLLQKEHQWTTDNRKHWHKVWDKYKATQVAAESDAIEKLKASITANNKERDSNRAVIVNANQIPRLPRDNKGPRTQHWSAQPRVANQSFLQKARNQARAETARFRLSTATGKLPVRLGQIQRAPESMVNEKRVQRQFNPAVTEVQLVRPPHTLSSSSSSSLKVDRGRKEMEDRLLRIKGGPKAAPTVLTFDDSDDSERGTSNARHDDLFDDDDGGSPATTPPAKNRGGDKSFHLDVSSIEASYDESSGSPPQRNNAKNQKPFVSTPTHNRRRGLLSAAPGSGLKITKSPTKGSSGTPSPPAPKPRTVTSTAPPALRSQPDDRHASTAKLSPTGGKPLSSMTDEDTTHIRSNSDAMAAGSSTNPPNPPRRIMKRKPVDIFMPMKRARK